MAVLKVWTRIDSPGGPIWVEPGAEEAARALVAQMHHEGRAEDAGEGEEPAAAPPPQRSPSARVAAAQFWPAPYSWVRL